MLVAIIIGFLFGFVGSMPVAGPIAALVFSRAIDDRSSTGFAIAVGGALAEAAYAFVAFFGVSSLLARYPFIAPASQGLAGVVLLVLGIVFVRRRTDTPPTPSTVPERPWNSALLGFTVTALNPTLIGTWTAAAATLAGTGLVEFAPRLGLPFSLGAMGGIVVWNLVLLGLIGRYKHRFSRAVLNRVIQWMGLVLTCVGVWFCISFGRWAYLKWG